MRVRPFVQSLKHALKDLKAWESTCYMGKLDATLKEDGHSVSVVYAWFTNGDQRVLTVYVDGERVILTKSERASLRNVLRTVCAKLMAKRKASEEKKRQKAIKTAETLLQRYAKNPETQP